MSDSHSNKSLPSFSSSSCGEPSCINESVSAKVSTTSSNTVTVNGTVVAAANESEGEASVVSGEVRASSSNENPQQTVTIVTATVATTTVQATSNTTKTVVKERSDKLVNLQRISGGSTPCNKAIPQLGPVKQQSGPAAIMTVGSGRSSVSSLASSSAGTTTSSSASCCCNGPGGIQQLQHQQSLNQALAIVANKWDREQRIQDQENTRRLTLLKQRKISAILKVGKKWEV